MLNSQEHFRKSVCCGMVGIEIRLQYSKGGLHQMEMLGNAFFLKLQNLSSRHK